MEKYLHIKDISESNALLKDLFHILNNRFYNGDLPDLPIYVTATTRSITAFNPYVTTVFDRKRKQECQFDFSDDILTNSTIDVCKRMLHVMCHYYCHINNIADTSRNHTYHNRKYKDVAEKHGLIQVRDSKYGWSISHPNIDLIQFCQNIDNYSFNVFRYTHYRKDENNENNGLLGKNPNSHSIKYICPNCGNSVRATKKVNIACLDCKTKMIS